MAGENEIENGITVNAAAAWTVGLLGLALALRYLVIESHWIGQTCEADAAPLWCWPRYAVVQAFRFQVFGLVSLAAALWSHMLGGRRAAAVAIAAGAAGLVLYNAELSALGFLLGLIRIARAGLSPLGGADRGSQKS